MMATYVPALKQDRGLTTIISLTLDSEKSKVLQNSSDIIFRSLTSVGSWMIL